MGLVFFTPPRRLYSAPRQHRACSPQQSPAFHRARAKRAAAAGPAPSAPGRPHPGPHPRRCPASPVLLLQQLLELLGGTRRRHLPRRHGPAAAVAAAGRGRGTGSRGGGPAHAPQWPRLLRRRRLPAQAPWRGGPGGGHLEQGRAGPGQAGRAAPGPGGRRLPWDAASGDYAVQFYSSI